MNALARRTILSFAAGKQLCSKTNMLISALNHSKIAKSSSWEFDEIPIKIPQDIHVQDYFVATDSPNLNEEMIEHLERLSLVRFSNKDAIRHLEKAITYAEQLQAVNTDGVEPMITVLEDVPPSLREDEVTEPEWGERILENASETVEDYFVTPPGNIPLEKSKETQSSDPKMSN